MVNRYDLSVDDSDDFGDPDQTHEEFVASVVANLPAALRGRCCTNEPWAGPDPAEEHGHTDCWVMGLAAREIDTLRATVARLETQLAALQRDTQPYIAAAVTAVNRGDLETKEN